MTSQYDFTNDDWDHVALTPVLVGLAVARAEESGFLGSIRETRTLLSETSPGGEGGPAAELIAQASGTDTSIEFEARKTLSPEALADDAEDACVRLVRILDGVADPEVAGAYKRWVLHVATSVAEAAKEGGTRVSEGERQLIERLTTALGLD